MEGRLAALLPPLALLLLAALGPWPSVRAFEKGAPNSERICRSLEPGHQSSFQDASVNPFVLEAEVNRVEPGQPMNVAITSRQGFFYKGFIMQARAADSQEPVGTFSVTDAENSQTISCFNAPENTVTHTSPALKNVTSFQWTSPRDFNGPVNFNATVVQDYTTYWNVVTRVLVGEGSLPGSTSGISTTRQPVVTPRTSTTLPPRTTTEPVRAPQNHPIYDGCGSTKACFGFPDKCKENKNCEAIVSVLARGTKYEFELFSPDGQYVAVGLSDDGKMKSDSVMECVVQNGDTIKLYQSQNAPRSNKRAGDTNGLELKASSYEDTSIYCKFDRDEETTVEGVTINLSNKKYFLILAKGDLGDGGVGYHFAKRAASGSDGFLSDVTAFDTLASKLLFRLHGAFMLASWIGAASIGIVLARYFKQTWTGRQMCGKDMWFAWHRLLMVLVWCLTIAAFVIIFVQLKDWSYAKGSNSLSAHAILGIITTILAFIQPIGALFRPSPDSRRRPIFNWLHWCFGNSAHILAIVTIFLAGELSSAELPSWWIWIMVGYVAFHVLMHLLFSASGCVSERQGGSRINSFPMNEMSNSRSPLASAERKQEAPHSCFRKFLLALYIIGILGLTIALIVIAVLAPIEESFETFKKYFSNNSSE